jgi:hypothetical protein
MKAYTPEVASGNTSSPVRNPFNMSLNGAKPLTTFHGGSAVGGTPHSKAGVASFATPMHAAAYNGAMAPKITHEQRSGGVPHISMHPGGGTGMGGN